MLTGFSTCCKLYKLGLIVSGVIRNDFYVTLKTADLEKGSKKSAKNVEVRVSVVNESGVPIQVSYCGLKSGFICQT